MGGTAQTHFANLPKHTHFVNLSKPVETADLISPIQTKFVNLSKPTDSTPSQLDSTPSQLDSPSTTIHVDGELNKFIVEKMDKMDYLIDKFKVYNINVSTLFYPTNFLYKSLMTGFMNFFNIDKTPQEYFIQLFNPDFNITTIFKTNYEFSEQTHISLFFIKRFIHLFYSICLLYIFYYEKEKIEIKNLQTYIYSLHDFNKTFFNEKILNSWSKVFITILYALSKDEVIQKVENEITDDTIRKYFLEQIKIMKTIFDRLKKMSDIRQLQSDINRQIVSVKQQETKTTTLGGTKRKKIKTRRKSCLFGKKRKTNCQRKNICVYNKW